MYPPWEVHVCGRVSGKKLNSTTPWRPLLGARLSSACAGPRLPAIYPGYFAALKTPRSMMTYGCLLASEFRYFSPTPICPETFNFHILLRTQTSLFFLYKTSSFYRSIFLPVTSQTPGYPYDNLPLFFIFMWKWTFLVFCLPESVKFHSLWQKTPPCLHTFFASFTNAKIIFFIYMHICVQVDGTFHRRS